MSINNFYYSTDVETVEKSQKKTSTTPQHALIVYNDDINTFEHVINTLIEVCGHDGIQAEQCTLLIHYKGKCDVKHGSLKELTPACKEIINRGISAKIEL